MKFKNMTAGFAFAIIIIAGVLVNAPGFIAGGAQYSPGSAQYTSLSMSPFKGPSTAPVVITVFSDFQ
jgi:protein-disulfide isomerase